MRFDKRLSLAALTILGNAACTSTVPVSTPVPQQAQTPASEAFIDLNFALLIAGPGDDPINFIEAFSTAMFQDLPFKTDERFGQVERLTQMATDANTPSAVTLQTLQKMVTSEINAGHVISHWTVPLEGTLEAEIPHTHYGRLALTRQTPDGAECFDMATLTYLRTSDAQIRQINANMTLQSDLQPSNLPTDWPCAYLPSSAP